MNHIEPVSFIDPQESRELADLMQRKYGAYLEDRFFEASARHDDFGVYVTVTLRNGSSSFHYPVEGRMAFEENELTQREAALYLFDYIDLYFEEYLKEGGEVYLPIDWADYELDGIKLQLKGQIRNLTIEKMGDEILSGSARDGYVT